MSASEHRSSSAVRNLRSLFENKQSSIDSGTSSPSHRGRSSASAESDPALRPNSKIRASFVAVELAPGFISKMENSLSDRLASESAVVEVEVEEKQSRNPDKPITGVEEEPGDMKPADPASERAVSGGDALPPTKEDLGSKNANGPKLGAKKPTEKRPSAIATKQAPKAPSNPIKSPATQPRTPKAETTKPTVPKVSPMKKSSRSSLTAPTAASLARAGIVADRSAASPASKPKPREVTKPVALSSHLTAPTAASRAKHEPERDGSVSSSSMRASLSARPKPAAGTKSAPRASLAPRQRAESHSSSTSGTRKQAPAPDSSFLERMTKPTAASQSRTHEKPEVKSPPRSKPAPPAPKPKSDVKPAKTEDTPAPSKAEEPAPVPSSTEDQVRPKTPDAAPAPTGEADPEPLVLLEEPEEPEVTSTEEPSTVEAASDSAAVEPTPEEKVEVLPLVEDEPQDAPAAETAEAVSGTETPRAEQTEEDASTETTPALDATPAGLGSDETIR